MAFDLGTFVGGAVDSYQKQEELNRLKSSTDQANKVSQAELDAFNKKQAEKAADDAAYAEAIGAPGGSQGVPNGSVVTNQRAGVPISGAATGAAPPSGSDSGASLTPAAKPVSGIPTVGTQSAPLVSNNGGGAAGPSASGDPFSLIGGAVPTQSPQDDGFSAQAADMARRQAAVYRIGDEKQKASAQETLDRLRYVAASKYIVQANQAMRGANGQPPSAQYAADLMNKGFQIGTDAQGDFFAGKDGKLYRAGIGENGAPGEITGADFTQIAAMIRDPIKGTEALAAQRVEAQKTKFEQKYKTDVLAETHQKDVWDHVDAGARDKTSRYVAQMSYLEQLAKDTAAEKAAGKAMTAEQQMTVAKTMISLQSDLDTALQKSYADKVPPKLLSQTAAIAADTARAGLVNGFMPTAPEALESGNVIAGFLNLGPNAKVDDSTRKQWQSAFGDVVTPIVREKKLPDGTKVHGLILPSTGHWTLISPEVYGKIQAELASRVPKAGAKSGPGPTAVGVGRAIGSGVRTAAELPLRARAAAITAIPAAARAVGSTVSDVGSGITQGFTDGAQQAVPTR